MQTRSGLPGSEADEAIGNEPLWTTQEMAAFLRVDPERAELWRHRGMGPPAIKLNRKCVRYSPRVVRAWLSAQMDRRELVSA